MFTINSVVCGDNYTQAATLGPAQSGGNGGYAYIQNADVFCLLYRGLRGQLQPLPEVHLPPGTLTIPQGVVQVQFRNYVAGSTATVSGALSEISEPAVAIGSAGVAVPPTVTTINGTVTVTGGAITATTGSGYTVVRSSAGRYLVTFTTAFGQVPVVLASYVGNVNFIVGTNTVTQSSALIRINDTTGTVQDSSFSFIAYPVS